MNLIHHMQAIFPSPSPTLLLLTFSSAALACACKQVNQISLPIKRERYSAGVFAPDAVVILSAALSRSQKSAHRLQATEKVARTMYPALSPVSRLSTRKELTNKFSQNEEYVDA